MSHNEARIPWFTLAFSLVISLSFRFGRAAALSSRNLSPLNGWASKNGVQFASNVGFTSSDSDNWEISLLDKDNGRHIERGTVLVSVPKELVLSSTTIQKELEIDPTLQDAFGVLEREGFGSFKPEFLLMLKLLKEVDQGPKSKWYPWIQSLPQKFPTGVCFDDLEIECLPPFSRALVQFECKKLEIFALAANRISQKWIPGSTSFTGQCGRQYSWAFNVVYTRCWKFADALEDPSGESDIVPIGDLFNHKEPANVLVHCDASLSTVDFVLQSDMDPNTDGQTGLSLSYGLTNSHRFLVIFGFVDESMPEIFCEIVFPNPSADHISLGCEDRSRMVYGTKDGAISDAIWDSVLYALLAANPDEQQALIDAHQQNQPSKKKALHTKYALETSLTLRNHVSSTLHDLELLQAKIEETKKQQDTPFLHLPLIEKHNGFLRDVFSKVKSRLVSCVEVETRRRRNSLSE